MTKEVNDSKSINKRILFCRLADATMPHELDSAVRSIMLPLRPGVGDEYAARAADILLASGVAQEEQPDWVSLELADWERTGAPSEPFRAFVAALLYSPGLDPETFAIDAGGAVSAMFAARYFDIHRAIMNRDEVGHREARQILSHAHTVLLLSQGSGMTASRIYDMLAANGLPVGKGWPTVDIMLSMCGITHEVNAQDVQAVFTDDATAEPALLGDLSLDGAITYVADRMNAFGYEGDAAHQLGRLFLEPWRHAPYICMLQYQLTVLTFYNHKVANGYEFSPRGNGVLWLVDEYDRLGFHPGQSPFLNNAKSVNSIDLGWAGTKKNNERPSATALAALLQELDTLSEASRTACALYLRCLIHRFLRINFEENGALPDPIPALGPANCQSLIAGVGAGNTETTGVIEQRLSECALLHEHDPVGDWIPRGIGDSVFATNLSRKKFGDAELKHRHDTRIAAVEAHGGRLTRRYVEDHLFTMRAVLAARREELEDRAAIADWMVDLMFIAHQIDADVPANEVVSGELRVEITYRTFADLAPLGADPGFVGILNDGLVRPMNVVPVHRTFRQKVIQLSR